MFAQPCPTFRGVLWRALVPDIDLAIRLDQHARPLFRTIGGPQRTAPCGRVDIDVQDDLRTRAKCMNERDFPLSRGTIAVL